MEKSPPIISLQRGVNGIDLEVPWVWTFTFKYLAKFQNWFIMQLNSFLQPKWLIFTVGSWLVVCCYWM